MMFHATLRKVTMEEARELAEEAVEAADRAMEGEGSLGDALERLKYAEAMVEQAELTKHLEE